ncbi:MAG TPA: 50S ribosome-binding protein YggL [Gemmatimonadaceae bacterium]|nr:50S ribosome-binding protein YggL [Gemmatimonadaceae bacterium]
MSPACPVFGFLIHVRARAGVHVDELARQLTEFLATQALVASGEMPTLLVSGESMQATEADREAVCAWLENRSEIAHVEVGPLSDIGSAA